MRKILCLCLCAAALQFAAVPVSGTELIPVGSAVALELTADGAYVVDFDPDSPAREAGLQKGDLITAVNGAPLEELTVLTDAGSACAGKSLTLDLLRDGRAAAVSVTPVRKAGGWRLGLYVKDKLSGIGTVTFYDPESGLFAALGHGVSEGEPGSLFRLRCGFADAARITAVERGAAGNPGSLHGAALEGEPLGTVTANTPCGVFGTAEAAPWMGAALPVAAPGEVCTGSAQILATVDGVAVRSYDIRILELHPGDRLHRNLLIQVTDPALLAKTGGIVQGMSGSPILQNGRLVGAVTHVLINNPARGYGILAAEKIDIYNYSADPLSEADL